MSFAKSIEFRKEISKRYSPFYRSYPRAFMVLDYMVQMRVLIETPGAGVKERDFEMGLDLSTDLLTRLYCNYLHFTSFFVKKYRNKFTVHLCVDQEKFPGLDKVIEKISADHGWVVVGQSRSWKELLSWVTLKVISPYRYFLSNKTKKLMSRFKCIDDETWWSLLADVEFMKKLDFSVQQDVIQTSAFLERIGVNLFINTGDSSSSARVLIEASKLANVRCISFAHGLIASEYLQGIAPIHSDRLIVWTERQVAEISRVLDPGQAEKLAYVGFPKNYSNNTTQHTGSSALLLLGPIEDLIKDDYFRGKLEVVIETLKKVVESVRIRLHPHERYRSIPSIEALIRCWDLENSDIVLGDDISAAQIIVGAGTSTLLEAASTGKIVYEIRELVPLGLFFEGGISVTAEDLKSKLDEAAIHSGPNPFSFDEGKLSKKIFSLIDELWNENDLNKVSPGSRS